MPSPLTRAQATNRFNQLFPSDEFVQNCGSNQVMGLRIWEIWATDDTGNMATRFMEERDGQIVLTFDVVEKLFAHVNSIHDELIVRLRKADEDHDLRARELEHAHQRERAESERKDRDAEAERRNKRFSILANTLAALGGFGFSGAALLYLLAYREDALIPALIMLASTLVSCGTFLFGKFIIVRLEQVFGEKPNDPPRDAPTAIEV